MSFNFFLNWKKSLLLLGYCSGLQRFQRVLWLITCVYFQERHHFCHFLLLSQIDRIRTKTEFKRKKKIKKEERCLGERASLGWASLVSLGRAGRDCDPPRQTRPSTREHNSRPPPYSFCEPREPSSASLQGSPLDLAIVPVAWLLLC